MSFGLFKKGVNSTDKKLIKRFVAAGWPVDKISNKISVEVKVVKRVIAFQAGKTPPPVASAETETEAVVRMLADDKDATDIAVELDVELDVIEKIIESLDD